jgi:hypothetical protein
MLSLSRAVLAGPTAEIKCTGRRSPAGPTPSPPRPAQTAAPQRRQRRVTSWSVAAGLPVADRGEAPPLLGRGPSVEPVAAVLETADDAPAVLDRVVVVVLELGGFKEASALGQDSDLSGIGGIKRPARGRSAGCGPRDQSTPA